MKFYGIFRYNKNFWGGNFSHPIKPEVDRKLRHKTRQLSYVFSSYKGFPVLFQGSRSGALILWRKQFQSDKRPG